jgi:hypothetical protein
MSTKSVCVKALLLQFFQTEQTRCDRADLFSFCRLHYWLHGLPLISNGKETIIDFKDDEDYEPDMK